VLDKEGATRTLASLVAGPGRHDVLAFIARSIRFAHEHAIETDQVIAYTIEEGRRFRVMAGRLSMLSTWKSGLYVEMDRATLGDRAATALGEGRELLRNAWANTPPTVGVRFDFDEVGALEAMVRPAHEAFISHALELGYSQHHKRREPALLAVLRQPPPR
jgi:hypothetical protein